MANILGYRPGSLIMTLGNVHLYEQHVEAARTQLEREPRSFPSILCTKRFSSVDEISFDDFTLLGYEPYEKIEAVMVA
jgi:thymidylate synthase